ncbi:glycosyl transferase family 2 [Desulfovibrio sp. X2]|uniref:glycosyltransferase family 2 protein n=1 Tax=Desulfovibrio sp. X2 TaxID=941449 RepID=UPI000358A229|nr:glycosyltransferase family 2 protein [Desulfovibrio sp. X2]EPR40841.1 glycosyl transferase family 2 [Desulfovibrio sp. X2]
MPAKQRTLRSISLVIPVFNEVESLGYLRKELERWLPSLGDVTAEVLLVDDGSRDGSLPFLAQWAADDSRVKVISFSRNFGHQAAVSAGLQYARGEAVAVLDADLQDPLDVVHDMIARYEEGYDVAYGQRVTRHGETRFKLATAWLFYRIMRFGVHKELPVDAGDFRLISRRCVDSINAMPETHRFLRGMVAWSGFPQVGVPYERAGRRFGETKYSLRKMLRFAWNAITSFSTIPLKLMTAVGAIFFLLGLGAGAYALSSHIFGHTVPGWTSLMGFNALADGLVLIGLGLIGDYVGKIYEEVKRRPLYIIQRAINVDEKEGAPDNR